MDHAPGTALVSITDKQEESSQDPDQRTGEKFQQVDRDEYQLTILRIACWVFNDLCMQIRAFVGVFLKTFMTTPQNPIKFMLIAEFVDSCWTLNRHQMEMITQFQLI